MAPDPSTPTISGDDAEVIMGLLRRTAEATIRGYPTAREVEQRSIRWLTDRGISEDLAQQIARHR